MTPLRILISRPDRLGDVVLSTPLPREIKKKYPESYIAVLLTGYTKDIYLNNPYVDKIIIRKDNAGFDIVRTLREYAFSHAFMLLPAEAISWMLMFAGIKKRFGVGFKIFQFLTNTKSVYRNKYIPLRHESEYCLDFIRKLNIEPEDASPEIYLNDEEKEKVTRIKSELSPGKIIIGINTTSGKSAPNWMVNEYSKLIDVLLKIPQAAVVLTDVKPPQELKENPEVIFINENKKLRDSIINFASIDVLISGSTGPMHICAALKIPTVSLFCPLTACSPKLWGPVGNENSIVMPENNYCQEKCPQDPKKCTFSGEGGISVEKVAAEVLRILKI